jgi:hypothetical protein
MRLYPPIYPGDSILQAGKFPGGDFVSAWSEAIFRLPFVRSKIHAKRTFEAQAEGVQKRPARAAPNGWVGSKLKPYYEALVRKFERAGQTELENYLAASQNLAELEERIHRYERMQSRSW